MSDPRHITANGIDIAYLEDGPADGPLALCLHGFPDHAPTWAGLLPALAAAGFHAVAPWLRGYAPTALAPDGNYQTASLALDALALTDALAGDGEAVIVGHDWGAMAAYTAVGHRPERYRRLVALAVPHPASVATAIFQPAQLKRSFYMFVFQTPFAEIVVPQDDFAFIDFLWETWSPGSTPDPAFMRALKDTLTAPGSTAAAISYYRYMLGATPPDPTLGEVQNAGFGTIDIPTLYLHGSDDGCLAAELVDDGALSPLFPAGIEVERIPGSGHFLHLDRPDVVERRILEFLG